MSQEQKYNIIMAVGAVCALIVICVAAVVIAVVPGLACEYED